VKTTPQRLTKGRLCSRHRAPATGRCKPGVPARRRVAKFVDEEADASSGASADEAAEADGDGDGFLRDFIDDGTQAAGGPGQCAPLQSSLRTPSMSAGDKPNW